VPPSCIFVIQIIIREEITAQQQVDNRPATKNPPQLAHMRTTACPRSCGTIDRACLVLSPTTEPARVAAAAASFEMPSLTGRA
jgi:hypothetical protein